MVCGREKYKHLEVFTPLDSGAVVYTRPKQKISAPPPHPHPRLRPTRVKLKMFTFSFWHWNVAIATFIYSEGMLEMPRG